MSFDTNRVLSGMQYAHPMLVFIFFVSTSFVAAMRLDTLKAAKSKTVQKTRIRVSISLLVSMLLLFAAQLVVLIVCHFNSGAVLGPDSFVINLLACTLVFGILFSSLTGNEKPVWYPLIGCFIISLVCDGTILGLSVSLLSGQAWAFQSTFNVVALALRVCLAVGFSVTQATYCFSRPSSITEEEQQGLLPDANKDDEQANGYGTNKKRTGSETAWQARRREAEAVMLKRLEEDGNWFTYVKGFAVFLPYLRSSNTPTTRLRVALIIVCLLVKNALNVLVPRQLGAIMDSLTVMSPAVWMQIPVYLLLQVAASSSGVELLENWLRIPLSKQAQQHLLTGVYQHVMHLSANFHESTSVSDTLSAMYGCSGLTSLLDSVFFRTVPMLIDMVLAFTYLSAILGPYEGLISVASGVMFLYVAARLISNRDGVIRESERLSHDEISIRIKALYGWSTTAAFNQIEYECDRHEDIARRSRIADQQVSLSWQFSAALQYLTMLSGLAASAYLALYRISQGKATPGQFAMLLSYWAQLTSPLRYFIEFSENTKQKFVYCERLRNIMTQDIKVKSKPGAEPLNFGTGSVEFKNVGFTYDQKKWVLRNLNLKVNGGETVAFVGVTGAGKSTILKLLNRFHDVSEGSVLVDGQDVRDVELYSLRDRIGLVPQSTLLFNESVMSNVRYAKLSATDEEVHDACRAASMHDQILSFTDGYETVVGDRGVKLSGGEKQRIAIARAILKQPDIILLDEATSAVDTETETKIQASLKELCRGRTTFVIAHRLSTVRKADRIFVIGNAGIIEHGTHRELMALKGRYARLVAFQDLSPSEKEEDMVLGINLDTFRPGTAGSQEAETVENDAKDGTESKNKPKSDSNSSEDKDAKDAKGKSVDRTASTPERQKKEGIKLNPVAAEFTPRSAVSPLVSSLLTRRLQVSTPLSPFAADDDGEPGPSSRLFHRSDYASTAQTATANAPYAANLSYRMLTTAPHDWDLAAGPARLRQEWTNSTSSTLPTLASDASCTSTSAPVIGPKQHAYIMAEDTRGGATPEMPPKIMAVPEAQPHMDTPRPARRTLRWDTDTTDYTNEDICSTLVDNTVPPTTVAVAVAAATRLSGGGDGTDSSCTDHQPTFHHPRYSRRVQSKSEPSTIASLDSNLMDVMMVDEGGDVGSEDDRAVCVGYRRVSAPMIKIIEDTLSSESLDSCRIAGKTLDDTDDVALPSETVPLQGQSGLAKVNTNIEAEPLPNHGLVETTSYEDANLTWEKQHHVTLCGRDQDALVVGLKSSPEKSDKLRPPVNRMPENCHQPSSPGGVLEHQQAQNNPKLNYKTTRANRGGDRPAFRFGGCGGAGRFGNRPTYGNNGSDSASGISGKTGGGIGQVNRGRGMNRRSKHHHNKSKRGKNTKNKEDGNESVAQQGAADGA